LYSAYKSKESLAARPIAYTFRVSCRRSERYCGHARMLLCLSAAAYPHYCTENGMGWKLISNDSKSLQNRQDGRTVY